MSKRERDDLIQENRRLRTIIRAMAEHGDFTPLAIVEVGASETGLQLIVCTATESEETLAEHIGDAICKAMQWARSKAEPRGVGNESESPPPGARGGDE